MHQRMRKFGQLLALSLIVSSLFTASAAADQPKNGITVSPAEIDVILEAGKNPAIPLTVTNNYDSPIELTAKLKGIDENRGLLIPSGDPDPGLSSSVQLSATSFEIPGKQSFVLTVRLSDVEQLSPGGHYATLVLGQQSLGQSAVNAALSINMFIIKPTGALAAVAVSSVQTNGWLFRAPSTVSLGFTNTGNVHTVPRAAIDVRTSGGQEVAHGIANDGSLPILPGHSLATATPLLRLDRIWWPQRLTVAVAYRADGDITPKTIERHSWYIPPFYLLLLVPIVIVVYRRRRSAATTHATESAAVERETVETAPSSSVPSDTKTLKITVVSSSAEPDTSKPKRPIKRAKPAAKTTTRRPRSTTTIRRSKS